MSKAAIIYVVVGLLVGAAVGYFGTQAINRNYAGAPAAQVAGRGAANGAGQQPAGGPPPAVMEAIQKARNEPSNFDAQVQAADLYTEIGRYENALEHLDRALKLKPNDFSVLARLGKINLGLERYDEAEKWYQAALKLQPGEADVRADLGASYHLRQPPKLDEAIATYRAALKADPRNEKALYSLALALSDKGDKAGARETLARLEQVNPNNPALPGLKARLASS